MSTIDPIADPPQRTNDQEAVNAMTHGIGFLLSLGGIGFMVSMLGSVDFPQAAAGAVFVATMATVYAVSTLSHAIQTPRTKDFLRALDQGVIYLLISGTYTPFVFAYLTGTTFWVTVTLIWVAAFAGLYSKVIVKHRVNSLAPITYILLGWVPALALVGTIPMACLGWMVAGGVSYTVGVVFLKMDHRMTYFHATWHILVMIGSACHFYAIATYVVIPAT